MQPQAMPRRAGGQGLFERAFSGICTLVFIGIMAGVAEALYLYLR